MIALYGIGASAHTNHAFPTSRICPGQHFAESMLFILCASVLSAFDIGPPIGEDGTPIEFEWEATDNWFVS